jgi:hypothetical protein
MNSSKRMGCDAQIDSARKERIQAISFWKFSLW